MKEIKLTQGKIALVDDADYEWLNQWKWSYSKRGYAHRMYRIKPGKKIYVIMHRLIMESITPGYAQMQKQKYFDLIDHIDGNKLNNCRANLRICTQQQNQFNRRIQNNNSSGYKGVSRCSDINKWQACARLDGHLYYLGCFIEKIDAAKAYNDFAIKHFGEFARLNKI